MFGLQAEAGQVEKRAEQRGRVLKGGTLSFNRGYGALECVVRNVSVHGAKLSFGETGAVPQQFSLRIGPDGEWRQAEVRWRGLTEVGVSLS
jgi:hypothetical protein